MNTANVNASVETPARTVIARGIVFAYRYAGTKPRTAGPALYRESFKRTGEIVRKPVATIKAGPGLWVAVGRIKPLMEDVERESDWSVGAADAPTIAIVNRGNGPVKLAIYQDTNEWDRDHGKLCDPAPYGERSLYARVVRV